MLIIAWIHLLDTYTCAEGLTQLDFHTNNVSKYVKIIHILIQEIGARSNKESKTQETEEKNQIFLNIYLQHSTFLSKLTG